MVTQDKEKQKEYKRKHYLANRERIIAEVAARRVRTREQIREYKTSRGCQQCGETHPACLDFHHRDPSQKEADINNLTTFGWARVQKEIAQCDILCSNCHRKLHWSELHKGSASLFQSDGRSSTLRSDSLKAD